MDITEVRVKLVDGGRQEKLKAFCSITIDDAFVIRDLKIIEGAKGLFVAMPSRKLTVRCPKCGSKNRIKSNYCAECGGSMPQDRSRGRDGRTKLHADIAHPINSECREDLQSRIIENYHIEREASQEPGYEPQEIDHYDESDCGFHEEAEALEPVFSGGAGDSVAEESSTASGEETPSPSRSGRGRRRRGGRGRPGGGARAESTARRSSDREPSSSDDRAESGGEGRSRRGRRGRGGAGQSRQSRSAPKDRPVDDTIQPPKKRQKVVESSQSPPDDNFDVGIF